MTAQTAQTAREPHGYQNDKAEQWARYRRRDHANIEAMQNLMIAAVAEETGCEMKPATRALISALQGAHGGGEVIDEEFSRDYLTIGRQLQFTGTKAAVESRVRDWLKDLRAWQAETGYKLFTVIPGGQIVGRATDGTPIRSATKFIDHLKPVADDGVMRAPVRTVARQRREEAQGPSRQGARRAGRAGRRAAPARRRRRARRLGLRPRLGKDDGRRHDDFCRAQGPLD